jgi:hypothetical protein
MILLFAFCPVAHGADQYYGPSSYRYSSVPQEARRMGFSHPTRVVNHNIYRYRTRYVDRPYPVEVPVPVSDLDYDFNYDVPLVDINSSCGCHY